MTYTAGGTIQAADYNGFVNDTAGGNINATWGTGTTSAGYGQTALSTVSATNTVTAAQWASLVNTVASMANHQGTTITSRTAPVTGGTISILTNVATDISSCYTNRGNAAAVGTQYTTISGTNSQTASTSGATWVLTFTNTITFASSNAARYFFNAGGLIKIDVSKSSTGNLGDPEWNDLASTLCGDIYISGGDYTQTIAGTAYTGTTKVGGTGTPTTLLTTTGWFDLTPGASSPTVVYKQFADTAPYTANYIQHGLTKSADSTTLTITTTWSASDGDAISGGTAASGATPGTAPCTIVSYFPPSTTYLTNSWGTPTISASLSYPGSNSPTSVNYLVVAGGGGGGAYAGGGGGAGGMRTGSTAVSFGTTYTVTVGAGGTGGSDGSGYLGYNGGDSAFGGVGSTGGGGAAGGSDGTAGPSAGGSGGGGGSTHGGAAGTSGQGNSGGSGAAGDDRAGGGGGGAGAAGSNVPNDATGGTGGTGSASSISGSSVTYAGGGGGGSSGSGAAGGAGGGGAGGSGVVGGGNGVSGTANTGGGGGGSNAYGPAGGGNGGSGIVIISYPSSQDAATSTTGSPSITTSGGNRIYTWTGSGSITI